jgi:pimeloyl-ACP methyl ester carboxylesterase
MNDTLVMLPGMMCDARLFRPQIDAFSGERPVMVVPLVGADTIEKMAADILENLPPRFALAGLSMGGIVAMEIMRQAPDRVSRLALMDTNPKVESPKIAVMRDAQVDEVLSGGLRCVMREQMKPNYLADGPNTGQILDTCMAMSETLGPDAFVQQSRALQTRRDQTETLKTVCVPTLVLCGEDDTLCPIHRHQLMHDLVSGSELRILKNAGHLPTLEQPEATNEALRQWLTR